MADHVTESRRLAILVALSLATRWRLTFQDLKAVVAGSGYPASTATLGADIAWLKESGLVMELDQDLIKLTDRGLDVCQGDAVTPGVARPGPGG